MPRCQEYILKSFSTANIKRDSLLSNLLDNNPLQNGSQTGDADITKDNSSQEDDTLVLSSRRRCLSTSAVNPIVFEVRHAKHNPFNRFNESRNTTETPNQENNDKIQIL